MKKKKLQIGQFRKKGSVIIETIAAIPVLVFLTWAIINLLLYATSASQLNEAAYEASRKVAMDLRGQELQELTENEVSAEDVKEKIALIIDSNSFMRITKNEESYDALPIQFTREECAAAVQNEDRNAKNLICVYIVQDTDSNNKNSYQVTVRIRTDYKFSGDWGRLFPTMKLSAMAVSQVELPGRGNYVEY